MVLRVFDRLRHGLLNEIGRRPVRVAYTKIDHLHAFFDGAPFGAVDLDEKVRW